MIKAVIFDMDGVLIDAKEWHFTALNKALELFGYEINRYEHLVTYDGLSTKQKLKMLTIEKGLPEGLHSFINEMKQQYTMDIVNVECKPVFQHEYALSKLKEESYKIVVASNSIRNSIDVMIKKSNLIDYFDLILSNQDVKKPKPDPEIYKKAISFLGLNPNHCLIVEDNQNGLKAAYDSGAHVLKVDTVLDVNYESIKNRIQQIEGEI